MQLPCSLRTDYTSKCFLIFGHKATAPMTPPATLVTLNPVNVISSWLQAKRQVTYDLILLRNIWFGLFEKAIQVEFPEGWNMVLAHHQWRGTRQDDFCILKNPRIDLGEKWAEIFRTMNLVVMQLHIKYFGYIVRRDFFYCLVLGSADVQNSEQEKKKNFFFRPVSDPPIRKFRC